MNIKCTDANTKQEGEINLFKTYCTISFAAHPSESDIIILRSITRLVIQVNHPKAQVSIYLPSGLARTLLLRVEDAFRLQQMLPDLIVAAT